jgi:Resolvase, N terminal domain
VRVGLYARVSTERQHERGTIGSQLEALRVAARADGHEVIEEFVDDGYSGARLDRPGLDRLRDAAQAGVLDGAGEEQISGAVTLTFDAAGRLFPARSVANIASPPTGASATYVQVVSERAVVAGD